MKVGPACQSRYFGKRFKRSCNNIRVTVLTSNLSCPDLHYNCYRYTLQNKIGIYFVSSISRPDPQVPILVAVQNAILTRQDVASKAAARCWKTRRAASSWHAVYILIVLARPASWRPLNTTNEASAV